MTDVSARSAMQSLAAQSNAAPRAVAVAVGVDDTIAPALAPLPLADKSAARVRYLISRAVAVVVAASHTADMAWSAARDKDAPA